MEPTTRVFSQLPRIRTDHVCRELKLLWSVLLSNEIRNQLSLSGSTLGLRATFLLLGPGYESLNISALDRILLDNDIGVLQYKAIVGPNVQFDHGWATRRDLFRRGR